LRPRDRVALSRRPQRPGVAIRAVQLRKSALPQRRDIRGEARIDGGDQARSGLRRRLLSARAILPEDRRTAACKRYLREVRRNKEESNAVALRRAALVNTRIKKPTDTSHNQAINTGLCSFRYGFQRHCLYPLLAIPSVNRYRPNERRTLCREVRSLEQLGEP